MSLKLLVRGDHWTQSWRCDPIARKLADRHYSRQTIGARDFIGPGEALVLVTENALWVSRICKYRLDDLKGIECSLFRNEGPILSSTLIKEAVELSISYFGSQDVFTYVDATKIQSTNPGYCFQKAGFKKTGRSKTKGLILLTRKP